MCSMRAHCAGVLATTQRCAVSPVSANHVEVRRDVRLVYRVLPTGPLPGTTALRSGDFGSPVLGCSHQPTSGVTSAPSVTVYSTPGHHRMKEPMSTANDSTISAANDTPSNEPPKSVCVIPAVILV